MKNLKTNLYIYVKDFNEWIDLQNFLFSKGFRWVGGHNQRLFTTWGLDNDTALLFPRAMLIQYDDIHADYCMMNVMNSKEFCLQNEGNFPKIQASILLRHSKLKSLNEKVLED